MCTHVFKERIPLFNACTAYWTYMVVVLSTMPHAYVYSQVIGSKCCKATLLKKSENTRVKQFIKCVKNPTKQNRERWTGPAYINTLVLKINSQCNLQNHRFKLQDVLFSCELLYKIQKKKKGKAETPNRAVQEWLQLADACTAFFGNWT